MSKYLQIAKLDIFPVHRMVLFTLKSLGRDFGSVKKAVGTFVNWTKKEIKETEETDIKVEATLPQRRNRKKNSCLERWLKMTL